MNNPRLSICIFPPGHTDGIMRRGIVADLWFWEIRSTSGESWDCGKELTMEEAIDAATRAWPVSE